MTNPILVLLIIFFLAFLVESLVELFFGQLFQRIAVLAPLSWTQMYIAAAIGIAGAFVYGFDLVALLGSYIGLAMPITWYGCVLTGLAIGRGSNYIHDLVGKFFTKP